MPSERLVGFPVDWPAPARVRAFMSSRYGGVSEGPYASLNLGLHVGDDADRVYENRRRLAGSVGAEPKWLRQVHGSSAVSAQVLQDGADLAADAVWSTNPAQACAVLVADCLPVLLASRNARGVAAVHAGWRGLASGVIENAVNALSHQAACSAGELVAWLGPCIGPRRFEVDDDVVQAFGQQGAARFKAHTRADGSAAWLCDLAGLATDRLHRMGLKAIVGSGTCTVEQESDFFSFRRSGVTGRMAAVVIIDP